MSQPAVEEKNVREFLRMLRALEKVTPGNRILLDFKAVCKSWLALNEMLRTVLDEDRVWGEESR